jgi:hypothetical protein
MQLSPDTENVLSYLDSVSQNGLRKRNDMGTLLELAASKDAYQEMNDLVFHGRHLFGVFTSLRKSGPGSQGYETLEREFSRGIETLRELLAKVLVDAEAEDIDRFEKHYYAMTQGGLRNVVDLAHDLGVLKTVQNEQKYGGSSEAAEPEG